MPEQFIVGDDVLDVPHQPRSPAEIPFVRSNSRVFVILSVAEGSHRRAHKFTENHLCPYKIVGFLAFPGGGRWILRKVFAELFSKSDKNEGVYPRKCLSNLS